MINQFLLFLEFVSSWMWFCWNDSLAAGMIFAGCGSAMLTANANANKPGSAFVNFLCRCLYLMNKSPTFIAEYFLNQSRVERPPHFVQ